MIKIDKNVPIPKSSKGRKPIYDFASMKVGDSFWVEGGHKKQVSILNAAKRHSPKKFKTQTVLEICKKARGIRCWRVK
jgi:hypothetical protein